jgi:uncharacterized membrane protein
MSRYDYRSALRTDRVLLIIIVAMFAAGAWAYPQLPARVPSHWNIRGEIDGYSGPLWGAFGLPGMSLAIYLGMVFMPLVDPRRENYARFGGAYRFIRWLIIGFFALLHGIILAAGLGYAPNTGALVQASVALMFILLGNVMGQVKQNWFVGIKTPWTLADDEVWRKTHRVSAWVWTAAGTLGLVTVFLPAPLNFTLFMGLILGAAFFSIVYSYVLYRSRHP